MPRATDQGAYPPRLFSDTEEEGTGSSVLDSFLPLLHLSFLPSLCAEGFIRRARLSIPELLEKSVETTQPRSIEKKRYPGKLPGVCESVGSLRAGPGLGPRTPNPAPLRQYFVSGTTSLLVPSGAGGMRKQPLHSKGKDDDTERLVFAGGGFPDHLVRTRISCRLTDSNARSPRGNLYVPVKSGANGQEDITGMFKKSHTHTQKSQSLPSEGLQPMLASQPGARNHSGTSH